MTMMTTTTPMIVETIVSDGHTRVEFRHLGIVESHLCCMELCRREECCIADLSGKHRVGLDWVISESACPTAATAARPVSTVQVERIVFHQRTIQ